MPEVNILFILILLISLLVSAFGTVVGFGGGIFVIPLLLWFFDYSLIEAVGSVAVSLVPATVITTLVNLKSGLADFTMGSLLEVPTVAGAVAGSLLLAFLPLPPLKFVFAIMVMLLGYSMWRGKSNTSGEQESNKTLVYLNSLPPVLHRDNKAMAVTYSASLWMILLFGGVSGMLAGLFGVGGGFMKTPVMIKVFKMPSRIAAATAIFMIMITTTASAISHYSLGHVLWDKTIPVAVGFIAGAFVGKMFDAKLNEKTMQATIAIALALAGLLMLLKILF